MSTCLDYCRNLVALLRIQDDGNKHAAPIAAVCNDAAKFQKIEAVISDVAHGRDHTAALNDIRKICEETP